MMSQRLRHILITCLLSRWSNYVIGFTPTQTSIKPLLLHPIMPTQQHFLHTKSRTIAFSPSKRYSLQEPEEKLRQSTQDLSAFQYQRSLPESQYTQLLTSLSLTTTSQQLRSYYDEKFQDPRQPDANRFVWDPWFVTVNDGKEGQSTMSSSTDDSTAEEEEQDHTELEATGKQIQYSLKRVQCSSFFSQELYDTLIDDLVGLASSIGLTSITPPWMSLYTEGDLQNFHTDSAHGQMAFVLSLSQEGNFHGGETILMRKEILEFWKDFDSSKGMECGSILRYVPCTPLGKCIAFDPRVPHGVNRVTGTQDPRSGRVVIHGWFNTPENVWFGPWKDVEKEEKALEGELQAVVQTLGGGEVGRIMGYLAVRVEVDQYGCVGDVVTVCDTLQADLNDFNGIIGYDQEDRPVLEDAVSDVKLTIHETLTNIQFEPLEEGDEDDSRSIVIPFVFE